MTTAVAKALLDINIEQLHESKRNPRRHFHDASLVELAASITVHGILTPLLARPIANGKTPAFELAAGHRRYRAAKLAGLTELPVLVREMTDVQFLEVLTIENLQREDIHALEEAQGYADLIKHAGYDVARIAERVGRSVKYVYDRLRLLQLTPALQQLFFDNEITAGHAILLARLSADDQARATEAVQALFNIGWEADREAFELDDRRKPMSVRELQAWIDQHVRFEVEASDVVDLFPETAAAVAPVIELAEKIISITHNYHVDPGAKPEDGERTYTSTSWKRADGLVDSKECEHSVMGVIVVGPDRGQAFRVCTNKKQCKTHWGGEIREAAKRVKERQSGGASSAGDDRQAALRARDQEEHQKREAARAAFTKAQPEILDAIAAAVKKAPAGAKGGLADVLLELVDRGGKKNVAQYISRGVSANDLVRYLVFLVLEREADYYNAPENFPRRAKAFGVDVAKIIKASEGEAKKAVSKKTAAKKKAGAK
jgi:ParB/RepB/Spo0J family partition protein